MEIDKVKIKDSLLHLYPPFRARYLCWLGMMAERGFPVLPYETVRFEARQKYLVDKGRSRTMLSAHLFGLAVDSYPYNPYTGFYLGGDNLNAWFWEDGDPKKTWTPASLAFEEFSSAMGFTWGGDWNGNGKRDEGFFDMVHNEQTFGVPLEMLLVVLRETNNIHEVWRQIDTYRDFWTGG